MVKTEQGLNRGYEKPFAHFPDVNAASLAVMSSLQQRYQWLFHYARDARKFFGRDNRKVTIEGVTYDVQRHPIDDEEIVIFYSESGQGQEKTRIVFGTDKEYRPPKKIEVTVDRFNEDGLKVGSTYRNIDARRGVRLEMETSPILGITSNPDDKQIFNLQTHGPSFEANLLYKVGGNERPVLRVTPTSETIFPDGSEVRTDFQTGRRQITFSGRTIFIPRPSEFVSQGIAAVANLKG